MIVAIDPGGATGVAFLYHDGAFETQTVEGGFDSFAPWLLNLWWVGDWEPNKEIDAIIIENFVPRGGALSIQLDALHIIGAVKLFCVQHSIPLVIQTPTQAKSFASNDHLKAVGWYKVGADHERDAARHMIVFMVSRNVIANEPPYSEIRFDILDALAAM